MYVVNGKYLKQRLTGVQRVAVETMKCLDSSRFIVLKNPWTGMKGHIYEQMILPFKLWGKNTTLISMCNTGPLLVKNQILYLHDIAVLKYPEWFSTGFYLYYRFLLPILVRKCKCIITVSEFSKKEICEYFDVSSDQVYVIHNGVSDDFFDESFLAGGEVLIEDFLLGNNLQKGKYLLSVASIEPRKNTENLIRAWKLSGLADQGYKLALVGGNSKNFAKTILDDPDGVIRLGYVDDKLLPSVYRSAAGFVYVSLYEGFGLPPLEAMAAGIPVLTSNNTALIEVSAEHGLTCDALSSNDISRKMVELLVVPIEKIEKAKMYSQGFTWANTARRLCNVLEGIR